LTEFDETTQILSLKDAPAPRVLLVDDDELILAHLQTLLASSGFEARTVASGEAALEALQKEFTPIVIVDRNMPGMDGLALCRSIRERSYTGYIYLMLLTSQDAEGDILAGLDAGADDYLSKRASAAQLVARLRTARRILSLEHSLKSALEERRRMAMTDALTGAHNRRYFMRHLNRELKRTRRYGGELAVLLLDIDHFKKVNDRFGHVAGDEVLAEFATRIARALPREYDWCARLGGEEFAVVLPQTDLKGAAIVAEKVRAEVAHTAMTTGAGPVPITTSIGVSSLQSMPHGVEPTIEGLLSQADKCLYASKNGGRNRVTLPGRGG
jgi:two-component system cell cycle response regulator